LAEALAQSALRAIGLFAGVDPAMANAGPDGPKGGLQAVSQFMETNIPEAERERAGEVLVRILNGVLFELNQLAREQQGLKPAERDEATRGFMNQSVLSLSDSFFYPAPMAFMLDDFKQVQASVFQVSRAPGKTIVYLGCLFLIIGIFMMLYVRERRLWVWLAPVAGVGESRHTSYATMALSTNRKTLEADKEFDVLKQKLLSLS
jgi:cytochrome c biogenesis protein